MKTDNNWTHRTPIQKLQNLVAHEVPKLKHDHSQEALLVQQVKEGDELAYMELVTLYAHLISEIYRYPHHVPFQGKRGKLAHVPDMNAYDKEDILQEILLHFYALVLECDSDRPLEGLLKGNLHFRFYHNFFDEFLEIDKNEENLDEMGDSWQAVEDSYTEVIDIFLSEDGEKNVPANYLSLYQAMNQLTPRERECLEMHAIRGWNSKEISEELGISDKSVREYWKRAKAKLKTILKGS